MFLAAILDSWTAGRYCLFMERYNGGNTMQTKVRMLNLVCLIFKLQL